LEVSIVRLELQNLALKKSQQKNLMLVE